MSTVSGPIAKALDEVRFRIPKQILEKIFIQKDLKWRMTPPTLEDQIVAKVIRDRVMVDCNLVGGTEAFIPLAGCPVERTNDFTSVYRIPKSYTNGRTINSVLNITFSDPNKISNYGVAAGVQNTMMLQAGSNVMDSYGSIPITSTARVQLIGENVVMVRDTVVLPANIYLRCVLANDETLSHIQLRSYSYFAELVVFAVKAYIYNTYVVEMDLGELHGGQQLGKIKEIIDSYSDADELYRTFLKEKWAKVAFMNDQETWGRTLRSMIGGAR